MNPSEHDVRQAYLCVLGREADPVGLAAYVSMIDRGNTTRGDVYNEMYCSAEYRSRYSYHPQGRQWLNDLIAFNTDRIVQSGPFRGLKLLDTSSRGDGDMAPKLLGAYEQDLHPYIVAAASKNYDAIVDIGCAEGYYAVGLAKLCPGAPVLAFDTDQEALEITRRTAALNGCSAQITTGPFCDATVLKSVFDRFKRCLVIADCEGYEKTLFSDSACNAASAQSDLIIECHDLWDPTITPLLTRLLGVTHEVSLVHAGGRNPNVHAFLRNLTDWERWLAVWERREGLMNWIVCTSRT